MALFKIFNNISSGNTIDSLTAHQQGYCYFDANTNKFYVDTSNAATGLRQLNGTYYGECSTGAATTAKVVTIAGFKLAVGASVYVKFTSANTGAVGSLTLNVSGTGAKPIKRYGTTNLIVAENIGAGMVCNFVYDGTNWLWVGHIDNSTNLNADNLTDGTVPFARLPAMYWSNIEVSSEETYNTTPEMATIKLNGDTSANAASTSNVSLVFDTTTQALNFVFT